MPDKKYFTIDQKKHVVTVDTTVKPAKGDEEAVALYVKMGYDMRMKSQKRAAKMAAKAAESNIKKADIEAAIKGDKEAVKVFNAIMKGEDANHKKGFFAAKAWYLKEYQK